MYPFDKKSGRKNRKMKKQRFVMISAILMVMMFSVACGTMGFGFVRGSGRVDTETHAIDNVMGVELATFGDLTIEFGNKEELRIEAEDNLLPYFEISVNDGQLTIGSQPDVSLHPTKPVNFYLTVQSLDTIMLSGSGNITAPNLEAAHNIAVAIDGSGNVNLDDLDATEIALQINGSGNLTASSCTATTANIRITGSGNVTLDELEADTLDVRIPGSGKMDVAGGEVAQQSVSIDGSGDYRARSMESDTAEVDILGSGSVTVLANEHLDINIAGSGSVAYAGQPTIDQRITGSGDITRLGE